MLKIQSIGLMAILSTAVLLTACGKKETPATEQVTQDTVASASAADLEVSSTPAIVTPEDQIDAAP